MEMFPNYIYQTHKNKWNIYHIQYNLLSCYHGNISNVTNIEFIQLNLQTKLLELNDFDCILLAMSPGSLFCGPKPSNDVFVNNTFPGQCTIILTSRVKDQFQ